jgi:predicted acylesterase/phospholipase RssA
VDKWWLSGGCDLVNGVFKGGGARGVAYAGALRAVEGANKWFGAVAGSSAGAITATLVAAGLKPDELDDATTAALGGVKRRLVGSILRGGPLYNPQGLHKWLDRELRTRVRGGISDGSPVDFEELVNASGIRLFVVVMDLHTKAPVIFSADLTPHVAVADAVLASSAIPGALPAGRSVIEVCGTTYVDQLVDGGSYANFPQFIFTSPSFRTWYKKQVPTGRPGPSMEWAQCATYGFVLDDELTTDQPAVTRLLSPSHAPTTASFDRGTSATSGKPLEYVLSDVVGSVPGRLAILAATLVLVVAAMAAGPDLIRSVSLWFWGTLGRFWLLIPMVALFVLTLAVGLVVLVGLAVVTFGRVVSTTVVPAVLASLGVATGVPPWVGCQPEPTDSSPDVKVLRVPARGTQTLSFRLRVKDRRDVVRAAEESVGFQLAFADRVRTRAVEEEPTLGLGGSFVLLLSALIAVVSLTGAGAFLIISESHGLVARVVLCLASLGCTAVSGGALWMLLRRGAARARFRACASNEDADKAGRRSFGRAVAGVVVVLAALAGAQWIGDASKDDFQTARVRSTVGNEKDDRRYYEIKLDRGGSEEKRYGLLSKTSLRVNDQVLVGRKVEFSGTTPRGDPYEDRTLSRPLPLADPFVLQLAAAAGVLLLGAVGVGLLVSAAKDHQLVRHRRRLARREPASGTSAERRRGLGGTDEVALAK